MQRNFDRTSFGTGAAEGASVWQILGVFIKTVQQRRVDDPHWPLVASAIAMASDVTEHWADVLAGAAAHTAQHGIVFAAEDFGTAIINDDDVHFLCTILRLFTARAVGERHVAGNGRADGTAHKDLHHRVEGLHVWQQTFHPHKHDLGFRQTGDHAAIAFVGENAR